MNLFPQFTGTLIAVGIFLSAVCAGDDPVFQVKVKEGKVIADEIVLPVDPTIRAKVQHANNIYFGIMVDNVRITCSPMGSVWPSALVDGALHRPANQGRPLQVKPLPPGAGGKQREGWQSSWAIDKLQFTQAVEIVASKPPTNAGDQKRRMNACRMTCVIENKDTRPHTVGYRTNVDILVRNNDGALYASPVTHPGKILNGVDLKEKTLPPYVQVLENADLTNPGFVATMTLKFGGRCEGPNRLILTNLSAASGGAVNGWEVQAQPAGDSACVLYWETKVIPPGQKRELVWAYGGGIAGDPENEGKLNLALGGNLEPGKLFTVSALIEDPVHSQTLTLDLPPGISRVEGHEVEPVPSPNADGLSMVLWKARVERPGEFEIKVSSSTGVTQSKTISILRVGGGS